MAKGKVGRPKKVGKYRYHIRTGGIWGNLGQTEPAWNRPDIVKDTDTECKRAVQKFFRKFLNAQHAAVLSLEEKGKLDSLLMELDDLREAQAAWEYDSFEAGPLEYRWSCAWGDQATFTAVALVTRAKAEQTINTGGLL